MEVDVSNPAVLAVLDKLEQARRFFSVHEIARELEVNTTTVHRWMRGHSEPKIYVSDRLQKMIRDYTGNQVLDSTFTFIDLFAGIGGIRKGFEQVGGRCVFTSEWDEYAQRTYNANFPSLEPIAGDITKVDAGNIPAHDVLLAGFPCQPFSIAGVSKKNSLGRSHGFADETQGTLFFDIARIIDAKRPEVFVLENVKNLHSHDKGRTFEVIMRTLQQKLRYIVDYKILDGQHWVPQHRERVVIIGSRDGKLFSLDRLRLPPRGEVKLNSVLHRTSGDEPQLAHDGDRYFDHARNRVQEKYTLTDHLWRYLQAYAAKHRSMGNGFGFGLVNPDSVTRTLSARYYKDGSEILVDQGKRKNPRRLTPRECARLMGYPDDFVIPVSDTRAYKQ
ncbi:MAG: DNA (cytosine-5-)-methyltransferase, partial [Candidatus Atribacteria bacterium]